jgi:thiol:disulfide interchange protein DsbC
MKIKHLLLIGLMGIGFVYADNVANSKTNFEPKVTTDKSVTLYFNKLLPTTQIDKIYSTPYPDTYALLLGQSGIVYGNLHSNYLMAGHLFNLYTQDDLTDQLIKINTPKIDISKINLSDAVVSKAPTKVNKKLIVFIDPDCPYCRQLEEQMYKQGIDKKADIYYVLMPLPMHPNAKEHVKNIICSNNQIATLKEYMVNNNENPNVKIADGCNIEAVLERTGSISRELGINGTPAIITGDGTMIMGADIDAIYSYVNGKK